MKRAIVLMGIVTLLAGIAHAEEGRKLESRPSDGRDSIEFNLSIPKYFVTYLRRLDPRLKGWFNRKAHVRIQRKSKRQANSLSSFEVTFNHYRTHQLEIGKNKAFWDGKQVPQLKYDTVAPGVQVLSRESIRDLVSFAMAKEISFLDRFLMKYIFPVAHADESTGGRGANLSVVRRASLPVPYSDRASNRRRLSVSAADRESRWMAAQMLVTSVLSFVCTGFNAEGGTIGAIPVLGIFAAGVFCIVAPLSASELCAEDKSSVFQIRNRNVRLYFDSSGAPAKLEYLSSQEGGESASVFLNPDSATITKRINAPEEQFPEELIHHTVAAISFYCDPENGSALGDLNRAEVWLEENTWIDIDVPDTRRAMEAQATQLGVEAIFGDLGHQLMANPEAVTGQN